MLTVRLPSMLRQQGGDPVFVTPFVPDVASLIGVLSERFPGFRQQMDDALFNVAINDELILHDVRSRSLRDGDVVELVPTISGGRDARDLGHSPTDSPIQQGQTSVPPPSSKPL